MYVYTDGYTSLQSRRGEVSTHASLAAFVICRLEQSLAAESAMLSNSLTRHRNPKAKKEVKLQV